MAGAIDVLQLAVLAHAASSPDSNLRLATELARRHLDHRRENVGLRIRIHAGPRRFAAQVRRGEISTARGVEHILDSVEVEKESVAATAGEERVLVRLDDVGLGAEGDLRVRDYFRSDRFGRAGLRALCDKNVYSLLAVLWRRKNVAERDVGQANAVVVDVQAVDGVGMERVGSRICIEDDHGPGRVGGRLERVEVAEVESLVAERRSKIESGKMIRHLMSPLKIENGS